MPKNTASANQNRWRNLEYRHLLTLSLFIFSFLSAIMVYHFHSLLDKENRNLTILLSFSSINITIISKPQVHLFLEHCFWTWNTFLELKNFYESWKLFQFFSDHLSVFLYIWTTLQLDFPRLIHNTQASDQESLPSQRTSLTTLF